MKALGPDSGRSFSRRIVNAESFWARVAKGAPHECWPWTGVMGRNGYGQFSMYRFRKGPVHAHRVAYVLAHGRIPDGKCVMHTCDNPPCVNPAHLKIGTQLDNMRDKVKKGRSAREGKEFCKYGHRKGALMKCLECARLRKAQLHERLRIERVDVSKEAFAQYVAECVSPLIPPTFNDLVVLTDPRRAEVFARFFGLYEFPSDTGTRIGSDFGITRERARQLRNSVMLKIGMTKVAIRRIPNVVAFKLKQEARECGDAAA